LWRRWGKTFSPSEERGIFKTADGGKSWKKVLYKDDKTGGLTSHSIPAIQTSASRRCGDTTWQPGNTGSVLNGTGDGAIYKTTTKVKPGSQSPGNGLPSERVVDASGLPWRRARNACSPSSPRSLMAVSIAAMTAARIGSAGNHGHSRHRQRLLQQGLFDPQNPDVVYVMQTRCIARPMAPQFLFRTRVRQAATTTTFYGLTPRIPTGCHGSDQGATISLSGGRSWSTWYNQPTGQVYHLSTDNRFRIWGLRHATDSGSVVC